MDCLTLKNQIVKIVINAFVIAQLNPSVFLGIRPILSEMNALCAATVSLCVPKMLNKL